MYALFCVTGSVVLRLSLWARARKRARTSKSLIFPLFSLSPYSSFLHLLKMETENECKVNRNLNRVVRKNCRGSRELSRVRVGLRWVQV